MTALWTQAELSAALGAAPSASLSACCHGRLDRQPDA